MVTKKKLSKDFLNRNIKPDQIFTPEDFSEEEKMIEETTEKFVLNEVMPALEKIENGTFDESVRLIKEAGDLGLIAADIPEEDGGMDLGKVCGAIISEKMALGRSFSITFGGQTGIGALPIAYFGDQDQKEKYLPDLLSGEKIAAYALTEPSSGTDALSLKTTAVLSDDGQHYVLNGEKQWITNSAFAHIFIVYAQVDEKMTAFIVEKDYDGLSTSPEEKKMGLNGSSTRSLILDNVKVPVENLIGEIGQGHRVAFNVLNIGRFKIASSALGSSKRAIELAARYANERKQFGQPIAQFNLIKEKLANMTIQTYASESGIYRTAGIMQEGFNEMEITGANYGDTIAHFAVECSMNKVFSTEALDFIIDEAVQIHGGYGYMADYEVETIYRDSRINRIFEGTNEINRIIIALTMLKSNQQSPNDEKKLENGPLQHEKQTLQLMKDYYYTVIDAIQRADFAQLNEEQEIAAFLADLVTGIYTGESGLLRAKKAIQKSGLEQSVQMIDCAKIFIHETAQQCAVKGLNIINHLNNDEELSQIAGRLISSYPENIVEMKRRIADRVIEAEKYRV